LKALAKTQFGITLRAIAARNLTLITDPALQKERRSAGRQDAKGHQ
jgi:hypothetical protein